MVPRWNHRNNQTNPRNASFSLVCATLRASQDSNVNSYRLHFACLKMACSVIFAQSAGSLCQQNGSMMQWEELFKL